MMKSLLTLAIALVCSTSLQAETPQEGAKAIHALIEAKDYKTLFTTRYSEWHKAIKQGATEEEIVTRLSERFEKNHELMLDVYKQLSSADYEEGKSELVQESETGKTATAKFKLGDKEIPFTLYEMKSGKWGFHL